MLPALADMHAYLAILIYPQRTQMTQKRTGLAASITKVTLPFWFEQSDRLKYFSAKDAKDAKCFRGGGFDARSCYAITVRIF
jgi:hypothetical protein